MIASIALSLDPVDIERISNAMYERVEFASGGDFMPLNEATQPMAFDGMEPFEIYELVLRCLSVNFFASLDALLSRIQGASRASPSPSTET